MKLRRININTWINSNKQLNGVRKITQGMNEEFSKIQKS
jgi:hypothetical protein